MTKTQEFNPVVKEFIMRASNADQSTREQIAHELQEDVKGKLSPAGQKFIDDLCQWLITLVPNDSIQYAEASV